MTFLGVTELVVSFNHKLFSESTRAKNEKINTWKVVFNMFKALTPFMTWSMDLTNMIDLFSFTFQSKERKV